MTTSAEITHASGPNNPLNGTAPGSVGAALSNTAAWLQIWNAVLVEHIERIGALEARVAALEEAILALTERVTAEENKPLPHDVVRAQTMYNGQYLTPDGQYVQPVTVFVGDEPSNGVNGPNPQQRDVFIPMIPTPSA